MRAFVIAAVFAVGVGACGGRLMSSGLDEPAVAGQVSASPPSLVGAWRVVRFCRVDSAGRESHPFGERPTGVFVYHSTGQLSLHAMRTPAVPPYRAGDDEPTDIEGRAMLDSYFGYFGTYSITSDSTVTHHVVGGTIPSYIGTDQRRHYRIRRGGAGQPDTLSIGSYPAPSCRKLLRVG